MADGTESEEATKPPGLAPTAGRPQWPTVVPRRRSGGTSAGQGALALDRSRQEPQQEGPLQLREQRRGRRTGAGQEPTEAAAGAAAAADGAAPGRGPMHRGHSSAREQRRARRAGRTGAGQEPQQPQQEGPEQLSMQRWQGGTGTAATRAKTTASAACSMLIYDVVWWCSYKIAVPKPRKKTVVRLQFRRHSFGGQLSEVGGKGVSATQGDKGSKEILLSGLGSCYLSCHRFLHSWILFYLLPPR